MLRTKERENKVEMIVQMPETEQILLANIYNIHRIETQIN